MKYGEKPTPLGLFRVNCKEMMFYQYLPVKMKGSDKIVFEPRLNYFSELVSAIKRDFISEFGNKKYINSYMYLTAKYLFQTPNNAYNRLGYHCDGFMTNDVNYIWCDKLPTIINVGDFDLPLDDELSMVAMEEQALVENEMFFRENELVRLNQYNVHKVATSEVGGMRTFLKVSFSEDKYDLIGNAHNSLIDYDWEMKERKYERNIPQSKL